ncbi:MAG: hypothetical protein ACRDM0_18470 [Thermoleophilaceae bacterium]
MTTAWLPREFSRCGPALQRGDFLTDAAARIGTYRKKGTRWVAAAGRVPSPPWP